jgi:O-antigen/teichoic acid export membrane protein
MLMTAPPPDIDAARDRPESDLKRSAPDLRSAGPLLRGATGVFSARAGAIAIEFILTLFLARTLDASGYGVYAYVLSWVALLAIPATLGVDRLAIREVAGLKARADWGALRGLTRKGQQVVLITSLAVALSTALVAWVARREVDGSNLIRPMLLGMMALPFLAHMRLMAGSLQGLGHTVLAGIPESLLLPGLVLLLTLLAFATGDVPRTAPAVLACYLASVATVAAAAHCLLQRLLPGEAARADPVYRTRSWLREALPFMGIVGVSTSLGSIGVIMLGWLEDAEAAGVYRVAWQLAALATLPLFALNMVLAPRLAAAHATGGMRDLGAPIRRLTLISTLVAAAIGLALSIAGVPILNVFGVAFSRGYPCMVVLLVGQVFNVATGSVGYLLMMTGRTRQALAALVAAAVFNVVLNLWMIPRWGVLGAGTAASVALILLNSALALIVRRQIGIHHRS